MHDDGVHSAVAKPVVKTPALERYPETRRLLEVTAWGDFWRAALRGALPDGVPPGALAGRREGGGVFPCRAYFRRRFWRSRQSIPERVRRRVRKWRATSFLSWGAKRQAFWPAPDWFRWGRTWRRSAGAVRRR